ncbi:MAG: trypsin-like peptidase domain-containing protein, partial [Thermoguttaceae bacterium]|nr:trypsin-like peptidase domain-containing protein [Thermoguttaceae bacterium]
EERTPVALYAKRNKSIVNVSTVAVRSLPFFGQTEKSEGTGSGIVLNKSGVILTNFHVVENVSEMEVTLFNGETYSAELIGVDPNTDVALVKINAPEESLFPVEFGDSSNLLVGQTVYAIGNPFGLERTMTKGIISNLNRTIGSPQQFRQIKGVIQIDAAINPGNSGGALFDSRGLMIGMNTAIASRIGENTGVGFAVPVNTIHRIVSILLKDGKVVRGDVGVVQVTETEVGLIPRLIDEGGAADQAGLRGGKIRVVESRYNGAVYRSPTMLKPEGGFDIITGVDGETVKTGEDFITAVEEHGPGETITLNVLRQGAQINLPVVLK